MQSIACTLLTARNGQFPRNPKYLRANGTRDTVRCMLINMTCIRPCNKNTAYGISYIDPSPLKRSQRLDRVIRGAGGRGGKGEGASKWQRWRPNEDHGERENHLGNHLTSPWPLFSLSSDSLTYPGHECLSLVWKRGPASAGLISAFTKAVRCAHRNNVGRLISLPIRLFFSGRIH